MRHIYLVAITLLLGACSAEQTPAPTTAQDSGPQRVQRAVAAFSESVPVRASADYSQAVASGLLAPMIDQANRSAAIQRHRSVSRPLRANERCYGGTIVAIGVENGVRSFIQPLGAEGFPIECHS